MLEFIFICMFKYLLDIGIYMLICNLTEIGNILRLQNVLFLSMSFIFSAFFT